MFWDCCHCCYCCLAKRTMSILLRLFRIHWVFTERRQLSRYLEVNLAKATPPDQLFVQNQLSLLEIVATTQNRMVYSWNCDRKTVAFCELRGQFRGCCQDVNACYRRRRAFFLSESTFSNCQFCRIQFVDTSPLSFWQLAFVPTLGLSSSYFSNGKLIDEGWNSFWFEVFCTRWQRGELRLG